MFNKNVLAVCLGTLCSFAAASGTTPSFEQYKVRVEQIRSPRVNLRSHAIGRKYRTQIRDTIKAQGVNFAGHYTVVQWGCGTECTQLAIVDIRTGVIWHDPDVIATRGYLFRRDSSLLIQDPWDGAGDFLPRVPTQFFTFREGRMKRVAIVKHAT